MTAILLDRMALDDVGTNPVRIAEAIHAQLGSTSGPVPVREIALALDIVEIREEALTSFEAALVTTAERDTGKILVNALSAHRRQRFSIGHELMHFLCPTHAPVGGGMFTCGRDDMAESNLTDRDRHRRQEAEANTFAIELLTPFQRVRPYLRDDPDLRRVCDLAEDFDVSREAAARRYVLLHDEALAAVFWRDGRYQYSVAARGFPELAFGRGMPRPNHREASVLAELFTPQSSPPGEWLISPPSRAKVLVQTLIQNGGWATTLLWLDDTA